MVMVDVGCGGLVLGWGGSLRPLGNLISLVGSLTGDSGRADEGVMALVMGDSGCNSYGNGQGLFGDERRGLCQR